MNLRYISIIAATALFLCGCSGNKESVVTSATTETTAETTFNEYVLVRGWTGEELLNSIYFCGEYHHLPMSIDGDSRFSLNDKTLVIDGFYSADVSADESGVVTSLHFNTRTAPADFSVYGLTFSDKPSDVQEKLGFADTITGSEETKMSFTFTGGGITQLLLEFEQGNLTDVYIIP